MTKAKANQVLYLRCERCKQKYATDKRGRKSETKWCGACDSRTRYNKHEDEVRKPTCWVEIDKPPKCDHCGREAGRGKDKIRKQSLNPVFVRSTGDSETWCNLCIRNYGQKYGVVIEMKDNEE